MCVTEYLKKAMTSSALRRFLADVVYAALPKRLTACVGVDAENTVDFCITSLNICEFNRFVWMCSVLLVTNNAIAGLPELHMQNIPWLHCLSTY